MNKQELTAMVAEILSRMHPEEPAVKAAGYHPASPGPQPQSTDCRDGDFVPDVTQLDLRQLYLTENPHVVKRKYLNVRDIFREKLTKLLYLFRISRCKYNFHISSFDLLSN